LRQNNSNLEYTKLEYFLSKPRLDRFLTACSNSKVKAQKLYRINLRVAQAFYPVLNLLEIFFRNATNEAIAHHFLDNDWVINQQSGFMSSGTLAPGRFYLRESVRKAQRSLINRGLAVTAGKIISDQTFGFWTCLYDPHHYALIGGSPIHAFQNKPAAINRSSLHQQLTRVREFRNRIYHNEPVCFNGRTIDFAHVRGLRQEIFDLFQWMDSDLTDYAEYFDSIQSKIDLAAGL
jgi:hypothetical protein